jgi:hypothetical protein
MVNSLDEVLGWIEGLNITYRAYKIMLNSKEIQLYSNLILY